MKSLQKDYKKSLEKYKGDKTKLSDIKHHQSKLREEIQQYFQDWLNPKMTGEAALEPIAKINIEVDSQGYVYTSLYNKNGRCLVSEGASPDLYEWGLVSSDEEDYEFEKRQDLVAQFLALCYVDVLPEACETDNFLSLPRESEITFTVGAHSGWEYENLYIYKGDKHSIDHGNVRFKRLSYAADCYTAPGTKEEIYMNQVRKLDVRSCADELIPVFNEFLEWLSLQNSEPIEDILIVWSSNFEKDTAFGGIHGDNAYRWPKTFELSKWFPVNSFIDLDEYATIRYSVSSKIAQIACLAAETFIELDSFKKLSKTDNLKMKVHNRTGGQPVEFYPFDN